MIDDLEKEEASFTSLFLVCGFAKHTEQVEGSATDKLDKLNDIVNRGGKPYAMIGYVTDDNGLSLNVYSRLLEEYQGDEEAMSSLRRFLPTIAEAVQKSGLTPTCLPPGQWLE
jgi:hypothetical protein